jgi:hypothetical protein
MSEQKISYLTDFSAQDYYAAAGYARGSVAGFTASVLFKDSSPFFTVPFSADPVARYICGNSLRDTPGEMQGWDLSILVGPGTAVLAFECGDVANAIQTYSATFSTVTLGQMLTGRSVLLQCGFAVEPGPGAFQAFIAINGSPVGGGVFNGFTPAPADNEFRVGFGQLEQGGVIVDAPFETGGIAGVTFNDGVPAFTAFYQGLLDEWAAAIEALDIVDNPVLGDVFSVRRGAFNAPESWETSDGAAALSRVGTGLSVAAARDRFFSGDATLLV